MRRLPEGARDLLPLDVAQKQWLETRLNEVFQAWGYQRAIAPTLERLSTLTAGGAVAPEAVVRVLDGDREGVGLRPEVTASLARAFAWRMEDEQLPYRLFYNANVFRRLARGHVEAYQAGVELLGCGGPVADGEILLLLAQGLTRVELTDWQVLLGHAGLTARLLTVFPADQRAAVRRCLARLDRVGLLALPLAEPWQERAIALLELRGTPEAVFARLTEWVAAVGGDLAATVAAERERLAFLVGLWQSAGPGDRLYLDLSTIETFDYYTGIVFQAVSGNYVVGRGGRYDRLLGLYHPQGKSYPGIGFSLHLEELQKVLQEVLPQQTLIPRWLVVPTTLADVPQAFARAAAIRQDRMDTVVEVYVEQHPPDTVRQRARARGIPRIVWVTGDTFCVESLGDG